MKLLFTIMGLLLLSCGGKTAQPTPKNEAVKQTAEKAFQKTNNNITNISSETIADDLTDYKTGEPGWITVSTNRIYPNSTSPDEAKQQLLQILRNEAIEKKITRKVEISSLLTDIMSEENGDANEQSAWSGFFKTTVSGAITNEKIMVDEIIPLQSKDSFEKKITLRAYVEPVQGQRDPGFLVDVQINNNMLKTGEKLIFTVQPSKDSYVYIFNLMADHNTMLMFPNEYLTDNFVKADKKIEIPNSVMRKYINFVVATMPGQELTTESVYIVCTKKPVPLMNTLPKIGTSMKIFSGDSKRFINLQRWLTNIPLNQRVEKNVVYHVSK